MYWTFTTSLVRLIRSGQNLIWKDWLTGLIGRRGIKKRKKKTADDFVGLSFSCVLLFVYGPLANTRYRTNVLYCLLSQTDRSLDSQTRATALHRLLSQAVCSLMTQEKQMPPFRRRLFFFCVHHMLTLSAISAILDSFSLVSPLTLE